MTALESGQQLKEFNSEVRKNALKCMRHVVPICLVPFS